MRPSADPVVLDTVTPRVRVRSVVFIGLVALAVGYLVPRMRAAFRLHSAATAFADYALCMVGPTGPSLLRDNPSEFRKLVRRRLIVADADDRPFSRCAKGAFEVTSAFEVERAHRATAASFVEYGGRTPGGVPTRMDELAVTTKPLADLSDAAWPVVRGGYTSLVQASAYAAEAPHPAELSRPGIGRGPVPVRSLSQCTVGEGTELVAAYALGVSPDHRAKIVRSITPEGVTTDATLAPMDARVFAIACDAHALVAAIGRAGSRDVSLLACAHLGSCAKLPLPRLGKAGAEPGYPLDIARVDGVTVLVVPSGGIVRVASTRDDGRIWTPFTVAFDAAAHPELRFDVPSPDRLFASGKRLTLYAEPRRRSAPFPLLVSDDAGASFHAP